MSRSDVNNRQLDIPHHGSVHKSSDVREILGSNYQWRTPVVSPLFVETRPFSTMGPRLLTLETGLST